MEAMWSEQLLAALWEQEGFLTRCRWPIRVSKGWSDIDVVGVNAIPRVRIAESKIHGTPVRVFAFRDSDSLVNWFEKNNLVSIIDNILLLWEESPDWIPSKKSVVSLEYWLCSNIWLPNENEQLLAEQAITRILKQRLSGYLRKCIQTKLISTRDLILKSFEMVRHKIIVENIGKRFGNPILDTIRELVRYTQPRPSGGGRVGKAIATDTKERVSKVFFNGLGH